MLGHFRFKAVESKPYFLILCFSLFQRFFGGKKTKEEENFLKHEPKKTKSEEPHVFVEEDRARKMAQPDFSKYDSKYEEEQKSDQEVDEVIDIDQPLEHQKEMTREEVYYTDPFLYRQKYAKDFDIGGL